MNSPRPLSRLLLVLAAVAAVVIGLVSPAAAAPYCGITWGSQPKVHGDLTDVDAVNDVRAGQHACYDRLVVDLGGPDISFDSYDVSYVPVVTEDGSGAVVPVRGGAALEITVLAPAYNDNGATYLPANRREVVDVTGFRTFRQIAWAGTFEGRTDLALGVRARLPFRVFTLPGTPASDHGARLVIDVAHRW